MRVDGQLAGNREDPEREKSSGADISTGVVGPLTVPAHTFRTMECSTSCSGANCMDSKPLAPMKLIICSVSKLSASFLCL